MTVFAEDDFFGTSGTFVESRPTNIGNKAWSTNAAGAFTLNGSGKAQAAIQVNANANTFDAGVSDFTVSCAMSSYSPDNNLCVIAVLLFRYVDANNHWGIQVDPRYNRVTLYNKQSGSQFDQMYIADATVINNAVTAVRIDCVGQNITVFVNGVQVSSLVSTLYQTATKCGIYMGVNGPSGGNATWGPIEVQTLLGLNYNWPAFTPISANGGAPVIPKGSAGTWDATDIANPEPFYDSLNSRWAMLVSGYTAAAHSTNGNAANSNILNLGLWTSTTIDGPWTADVSNPVMLANGTDGFYSFNGGAILIGSTYYQAYVSDNGTDIRWATSPDLHTWTRVGLICSNTVPAANSAWRAQGVFDPMLRVRQGSNVIEMWCCGVGLDSIRRFGLLASSDLGVTWVDQSAVIPAALPPVGLFRNDSAGEPSIYVPPGQEGKQYLISFDYVPQTQSGNPAVARWIGQGISLDGGVTWAWRIGAGQPGAYSWESTQNFDSFIVDAGDGTLRLFHSGANVSGPALGLNIQIGQQNAPWGKTTLAVGFPVVTFKGAVMAGSVITAGTTRTQAGATQITADVTTVNTSTAATAGTNFGDGVALPQIGSGTDKVFLINNTANPVQVYSYNVSSGTADTINGIAGATGVAMPPNSSATFIEANPGSWTCLLDAPQTAAFNTVASAATLNLNAAQISGGEASVDLAITGAQGGAITANLPTAANLLQSLYGPAVGTTYRLRITNTNTGQTITVTTATGWTLTGTMTIATATWREFVVTVTSASAITLQNVAVGTFS